MCFMPLFFDLRKFSSSKQKEQLDGDVHNASFCKFSMFIIIWVFLLLATQKTSKDNVKCF